MAASEGSRQGDESKRMNKKVYTYFVQSVYGGPIKIGVTRCSLSTRLCALQCGSPIALQFVGLLEGNHEKEWHKQFNFVRLHGEWFANHPHLVDAINEETGGCAEVEDFCQLSDASILKREAFLGAIA